MSSRRRHHHDSDSGPSKPSRRDEGHSRTADQYGPLAGDDPRIILPDRTRVRNEQPVLPNFSEILNTQHRRSWLNPQNNSGPSYSENILPSAAFRDATSTPNNQAVQNFSHLPGVPQPHTGWRPGQRTNPAPGRPMGPAWAHQARESHNTRGLVMPTQGVNNPNYRANYRLITSDFDKAMAEQQLRFNSLSPAEQVVQKRWAKDLLMRSELCTMGYSWWSYKTDELTSDGSKLDGYRCWAGGHLVTHELLVEDKGRYYTPHVDEDDNDKWFGPVWPPLLLKSAGIMGTPVGRGQSGQPPWKDPNWSYFGKKPGSSRPTKKKKWWKR